MARIILYHKGAYQLYSTISDAPVFAAPITRQQLYDLTLDQDGRNGLTELPKRLERAHTTGSSAYGETLEDTILCNRAGENEAHLSVEQFIEAYLTVKAEPEVPHLLEIEGSVVAVGFEPEQPFVRIKVEGGETLECFATTDQVEAALRLRPVVAAFLVKRRGQQRLLNIRAIGDPGEPLSEEARHELVFGKWDGLLRRLAKGPA